MALDRRGQTGFGLLEAIVALALLAGVGMAIFSWINTNLANSARLRQNEQVQQINQLAAAWLQTVDPARDGRFELMSDVQLRWTSHPMTPRQSLPPWPGGSTSLWELQLFELRAEWRRQDGMAGQIQVQRLFVHKLQELPEPLP